MKQKKVVPVIMAGGAGTRLWPLSSQEKPKQFHNFSGNGTLLNQTIERLKPLNPEHIVIVTSRKYEDLSYEELKNAGIDGTVLSEPQPKNTAAAILYSAIYLNKLYEDSVMIVLPADHHIMDKSKFINVLETATEESNTDNLVTIGIKPSYPETGYGYIKAVESATGNIFPVERFVEKPDQEKAKEYFDSGNYYWNSGIFVWKSSAIYNAFNNYMPMYIESFEPLNNLTYEKIKSNDKEIWSIKEKVFDSIESVSIDYGIMEKAEKCVVIPADFGWADLGSWKSIDEILNPDENENRSPTPGNAIFVDSDNCSLFSEGNKIAIVGLSNVVVVQAGENVLVINKDSSQDVRKVVDIIRKEKTRS